MPGLSTFDAFKPVHATGGAYELSQEELHELQAALVSMLEDISVACDACGISFMLAYGSCLGSVRHGGFIPWDDDLDIAMLRPDYERFASQFDTLLGQSYVLQSPERTEEFDLAFARIRKRGTVLKNRDDFFSTEDCGIYIDLFVLESVPDNAVLRDIHGLVSLGLGFMYSCRRFAKYKDHYLGFVRDDEGLARTFRIKAALGRLFSFRSVGAWTKSWYRWNARCRNTASVFLCVPVGPRHYFRELLRRDATHPYSTGEFAGVSVFLPFNCEDYLSSLYGGSFMELPPPEQRERHIVLEFKTKAKL